jgi:hypothetical protein
VSVDQDSSEPCGTTDSGRGVRGYTVDNKDIVVYTSKENFIVAA